MDGAGVWWLRLLFGVAMCWVLVPVASSSPDGLAAASSPSVGPEYDIAEPGQVETQVGGLAVNRFQVDDLAQVLLEPAAPAVTVQAGAPSTAPISLREAVGAEALATLNFDLASAFPEWTVEFLSERDGLRALTYPHEQRIEVFVREDDTVASIRRVLAHEIGHVVDVEWISSDDRDRWSRARSLENGIDWWPDESAPDFSTGAGDFAEAFAVWETGVRSQSTVGAQPTKADLELLAELVG